MENRDNVDDSAAKMENQLSFQRLFVAAEQARIGCIGALLTVSGLAILFHNYLNQTLIAVGSMLVANYLVRYLLAMRILASSSDAPDNGKWSDAFEISTVTSGILWGVGLAIWIQQGDLVGRLFLPLLVGVIAVGAMSSLGILKRVYSYYAFGVLVPVAGAFLYRNHEFDQELALLTISYAFYLIASASILRKSMEKWIRKGVRNKSVEIDLAREKRISEQHLIMMAKEREGRRKAELQADNHQQMLEVLLENLPGMAYRAINDGRWTLEFVSSGCDALLGLSADQIMTAENTSLYDILVSSDGDSLNNSARGSSVNKTFQLEYDLVNAAGEERKVIERGIKVFDEFGDLIAINGFVTDVTENHRLLTELEHLTNFDRLTGLFNRSQFEASVEDILIASDRRQVVHNLLYIDLDQFKLVNDTAGYVVGDHLLQLVASRLQSRVRRFDILARLTADEFAVLLYNCSLEEASHIAMELGEVIERHPYYYQDRCFWLTASIGISSTAEGPGSLDELLSAAEQASHAAKESGRNRVHLFDYKDNLLQQRSREMQWALEIPEAIAENRFFLVHQPIIPVGATADEHAWYEILLRLRDQDGNVIEPREFLPAAERYNLTIILDTWVIKNLLNLFAQNRLELTELGLCFVNLSGRSIGKPAFLKTVCHLIEQSCVPAGQLCFEITETAAVENLDQALVFMRRLKEMGCRFALDDFGSGLSSFGYLRNFPVDFLKIDGSFVKDINHDQVSRSIVASIKDVGHATGKKIIAEFVEDRSTLKDLAEIGVDYAQGYGIARPQTINEKPEVGKIA